MFSTFFPENYTVYEIMWKKMVEPDRPHMTIQCFIEKMRFAHLASELITLRIQINLEKPLE
jgi:hypothetical protein